MKPKKLSPAGTLKRKSQMGFAAKKSKPLKITLPKTAENRFEPLSKGWIERAKE